MATVHVRSQVHALFFVGDLPLSEETIERLNPVAQLRTSDILLRDVSDAIFAAADAMKPFYVTEDDPETLQAEHDAASEPGDRDPEADKQTALDA